MLPLKALHVAAIIIWLGNFVVSGVWSARAVATGEPALRRFAAREILFTDLIFTLLFGALAVISGVALARAEHVAILQTTWTRASVAILAGATLLWLIVLLPLEFAMRRLAKSGAWQQSAFVVWNVVGFAVTIALLGIVYLMVAKPV